MAERELKEARKIGDDEARIQELEAIAKREREEAEAAEAERLRL